MKKTVKMVPLFDRVVVKEDEAETVTKGGIYLPDAGREKPHQGRIIAVGPGGRNNDGALIPMSVHVGDHVLYGNYAGSEIEVDGEKCLMVRESEIFCVLEESEE